MPDLKLWTADECTSYGVKDGTVFWYPAARWGWTLSLPFVDVDVYQNEVLNVDIVRPGFAVCFHVLGWAVSVAYVIGERRGHWVLNRRGLRGWSG